MMKTSLLALIALWAIPTSSLLAASDPLPSWREGKTKETIVRFVDRVTQDGSKDFIPAPERIATFDNDGTLWCEQPLYFQFLFALDRVKALAPEHPEWKEKEPFASVLKGDTKGVMASGEKGLAEILAVTHTGMTTEEFSKTVKEWIATAKHPITGRLLTEMVYQPMLELMSYLREKGFKTYIVSGGGIEFMRAWTEAVYGVPPEQVIGSYSELKYELRDGTPVLLKLPKLVLNDDKENKPVAIETFIGRRPVLAFGNSDGDYQMLEWTTAGKGPRLGAFVHHDDAKREYAYDRDSPVGRLKRGLDDAASKGWLIVSMKDDWATIFPEKK